ncbi:Peptidoglycan-binding domain 1 protein [Candidatus Terasakiella magnetica]|nr:Peptidoglycan-binding domain 1 protein [Candidatus Terasakiella magnetica]
MNMSAKTVRRLVATAAVASLVASCAQPNPQTGTLAAAPKTPAAKVLTSFTPALRCMDDLFLAYGKRDIVLTTAGIPDSTGKVQTGTKEMLITAVSRMSIKSKAITYIDYDTERNDLLLLFQDIQQAGAAGNRKLPSYYIRGAITQLDDNALDSQQSVGLAFSFLDLGLSRDQVVSMLSVDMNMGETTTRQILPGVNASNNMAIVRSGKAGEAGGKIGKAGLNISMSLNQNEGAGAGVRALIELGLIELMGKLTNVPYWKCLEIDKTNPTMMQQARDWYDGMSEADQIKFVQRKLAGAGAYSGPVTGNLDRATVDSISRYKAEHSLIANGRIDFDLYYSLLDDQAPAAGADSQAATVTAAQRPASGGGGMKVTMNSDRGNRPIYRPNEVLRAVAELSQDGFLYCYYKDGGGTIARIFPNRFQPDPFVRGGKQMGIPGDNVPFKIKFDKAGAREQVACIGSDRDIALPSNLKAGDLTPLRVGSIEEVVAAFKQSNPMVSDAKLDIVVQ